MEGIRVDDPADPRVAAFVGLRDRGLRTQESLFVAEGDIVVERALRAGYRMRAVLVDATRTEPLVIPDDVTPTLAGRDVIKAITGLAVHRGSLGLFERRVEPTHRELIERCRRLVVLEAVVNPINLGVMSRSAIGLGMDGLLLDPVCVDPLYRRCSRVAMGEGFDLPTAKAPVMSETLGLLKAAGFKTVALSPDAAGTDIEELGASSFERLAVVLGAEGPGLRPETMEAVDHKVRIPLAGQVDSLNVGAAAAIAFYVLGQPN